MSWEVEDIEATVEWLRGRGVVFEEYDVSGLRTVNDIAEVRDSEGNLFGKGASERIQQMRKDLKRAEVLREELRRDIALCKRYRKELGDHPVRKE
jgi:hypothetical protein